jgi:hypothetical protein
MTGIQLAPELPIEEVLFLTLLCYLTMDVHGWLANRSSRRAVEREEVGA